MENWGHLKDLHAKLMSARAGEPERDGAPTNLAQITLFVKIILLL